MAFYIVPPGGSISLQRLSEYAVTRFKFLCKIFDTGGDNLQIFDTLNDIDTVKDAECLIEGTVKDKVSHFILRLACCHNKDMANFFLKAETLLFDFRFSCMSENELCRMFKSVDKSITTHLKNGVTSEVPAFVKHFLETMLKIKGDYSKWRKVVRNYLEGDDCYFKIPFWNVLNLVAERQVLLKEGIASVPVCKLREVVTSLFEDLLHNGVKRACEVFHTSDTRILRLIKTIKVLFKERFRNQSPGSDLHHELCHTEIDDIVHMFPPCMSHLHRSLRVTHRLKHHSRIQYSLFLKEAGLSVHEALMFWRKEYCQLPSNSNGCSHMWSKDEGRYTYNIRHLYGLEGSRINYRGHSCAMLQESYYGPQDGGGCPFSHFDLPHLMQLLEMEGVHCTKDIEEILYLAEEKQFSSACSRFFHSKLKMLKDQQSDVRPTSKYSFRHQCQKCDCPDENGPILKPEDRKLSFHHSNQSYEVDVKPNPSHQHSNRTVSKVLHCESSIASCVEANEQLENVHERQMSQNTSSNGKLDCGHVEQTVRVSVKAKNLSQFSESTLDEHKENLDYVSVKSKNASKSSQQTGYATMTCKSEIRNENEYNGIQYLTKVKMQSEECYQSVDKHESLLGRSSSKVQTSSGTCAKSNDFLFNLPKDYFSYYKSLYHNFGVT